MKKVLFTIDGFKYPHIGYTSGRRWNGWATPYFEKDEALRVMQEYNQGREENEQMTYDEENDRFIAWIDGYEDYESWQGEDIKTEDGIKHLYGIGAYSWVWDDTTPEDIENVAIVIEDFLWELDTYEHRDQYASRDELDAELTKQLQDFNVLKQALIYLYTEELQEQELYDKLKNILQI